MSFKHVRFLATALTLAAATIACSGSAGVTPPPSASFEPTPGPGSAAAPPRSADVTGLNPVEAGVRRLSQLSSYRAKVLIDTTGGDKIEGSFEFVAPDSYHLTVSGSVPLELVTVGPTSYVKTGGSWQAAEPTFLPFSPKDLIAQLENIAKGVPAGVAGGESSGTDCVVYKPAGDTQFCVDKDGPVRSATFRDGATTVKIEFSDFNAKIEIKQPV